MNIKNIAIVICATMAISLQAKKPIEIPTPQEWIKKNATDEQKHLILNLYYNNSLANLQATTYTFVPDNSPELTMLNSFPKLVRNYLIDKFNSLIFDQVRHQLKVSTTDVKISSIHHHKATLQEIKDFFNSEW